MYSLLKTFKKWEAVESCYSFGEYYHVVMKSNINREEAIKTYLLQHQFLDIEVHQITANIEDSFMALMNRSHD